AVAERAAVSVAQLGRRKEDCGGARELDGGDGGTGRQVVERDLDGGGAQQGRGGRHLDVRAGIVDHEHDPELGRGTGISGRRRGRRRGCRRRRRSNRERGQAGGGGAADPGEVVTLVARVLAAHRGGVHRARLADEVEADAVLEGAGNDVVWVVR